ncbi:hypothetical protein J2789_004889 [Variovorax paradoxus]|uniref:DUF4145 domain-containing protein n=1 Tax=Variovorax TaxID=34072 RepID=UPI001477102B|nr:MULTISPECIES: DUF4145 domain-containing protein [Variovorax]MDR6522199.1 hypothetical protein [Variovorax paradoxus]
MKLSKENLLRRQTAASAAEQRQDFSEFEWIKTKVAAMFVCSHCGESVACAADGWVDEIYGDDEYGDIQRDWEDRFTPRYFAPPLVLMDIPEDCPEGVASHLQTSFSMYFCNPGASANAARIALEVLMDEWGVPKDDNGKTLTLHQRLQRLPPAYSGLEELLLAVKWLGNDGSHGGNLTKDDVNTLYDILEVALHEAYDKKKDTVLAKARAINQTRVKKP